MKIDKTDEKIINFMLEDSKMQLRKMAAKLNVSFVTVLNRIRKLEGEGVIKKYCAVIDYEKLGFGVNVLIEMRILKGKLFELEKKISHFPYVSAVYDTTGEYDATIFAQFRTTKLMDSFLKIIQTYDFVEKTNTKLILNTIKHEQIKL